MDSPHKGPAMWKVFPFLWHGIVMMEIALVGYKLLSGSVINLSQIVRVVSLILMQWFSYHNGVGALNKTGKIATRNHIKMQYSRKSLNNRQISQIPQCIWQTYHNAPFHREIWTHEKNSVAKWCIMGYGTGALRDMCNGTILVYDVNLEQ